MTFQQKAEGIHGKVNLLFGTLLGGPIIHYLDISDISRKVDGQGYTIHWIATP